jgi:hypothetical protein
MKSSGPPRKGASAELSRAQFGITGYWLLVIGLKKRNTPAFKL